MRPNFALGETSAAPSNFHVPMTESRAGSMSLRRSTSRQAAGAPPAQPARTRARIALRKQLLHKLAVHVRQPVVAALEAIRELRVLDPHEMKHRRVEID